jgi:hypothetical protein
MMLFVGGSNTSANGQIPNPLVITRIGVIASRLYDEGSLGPIRIIKFQGLAVQQQLVISATLNYEAIADSNLSQYVGSSGFRTYASELLPLSASLFNGPSPIFRRNWERTDYHNKIELLRQKGLWSLISSFTSEQAKLLDKTDIVMNANTRNPEADRETIENNQLADIGTTKRGRNESMVYRPSRLRAASSDGMFGSSDGMFGTRRGDSGFMDDLLGGVNKAANTLSNLANTGANLAQQGAGIYNSVRGGRRGRSGGMFADLPGRSGGMFADLPGRSDGMFADLPGRSGGMFADLPGRSDGMFAKL